MILSLSSSTCLSRNLWGLLYLFLSCLACLVGVCSSLYVSCCCPLAPSLASLPPQPASHPYPPSPPISPHNVWIMRFLLTLRESTFLLAGCSFHLLVCPCRRGCEGKDLGYEDRSFLESGSHRRGSFLFSLSFLFFSIACYVSLFILSLSFSFLLSFFPCDSLSLILLSISLPIWYMLGSDYFLLLFLLLYLSFVTLLLYLLESPGT